MIAGKRGGDLVFLCLDYSRESKITAWSEPVDRRGPDGRRPGDADRRPGAKLRFRSGTGVFAVLRRAATVFRDFGDVDGRGLRVGALWHFNDMGKPGRTSASSAMDIVQDGHRSIGFQLPPYGSWGSRPVGPVARGPDLRGHQLRPARYPLAMVAPAIAPRLTTRCEPGGGLQRLAIDFMYAVRS
jgi:hypothetical protein